MGVVSFLVGFVAGFGTVILIEIGGLAALLAPFRDALAFIVGRSGT